MGDVEESLEGMGAWGEKGNVICNSQRSKTDAAPLLKSVKKFKEYQTGGEFGGPYSRVILVDLVQGRFSYYIL